MIESDHSELSVRRQCELLGVTRSTLYYEPVPVSEEDQALMKRIDRLHTAHPFLGSRKLAVMTRLPGEAVNRKRVQRLMRLMGLECLYPRPVCTVTSGCHRKYPYLLKEVAIDRPGQVWSADITYVPMATGFVYLAATIDWYSRLVVSWRLSNSLDGEFCQSMLEESLTKGRPEIFTTDQGVQFTALAWTSRLESAGVRVSMSGLGRCFDNIFVERLWRSVKYEELYPKRYATVREVEAGLTAYFRFYNRVRVHESLEYRTPWAVHAGG